MTYKTLMAHLELGRSNAAVLKIAGGLAERFEATVVGISACQPVQIVGSDYADAIVSGDLIEADRKEIQKQTDRAEADFRSALQGRARALEWRSAIVFTPLADYFADEARSADLIITAVGSGGPFEASRRVNTGDLVMRAGRPVLVVPITTEKLELARAVIGWKDTRETRRAALDALPLLKRAGHVTVLEIAAEEKLPEARARVEDVVRWLERHGIAAEASASAAAGSDASRLEDIAQLQGADLIVAGAYGHSRLREWVLGGVTRHLLLGAGRCSLLSH